MKNIVKCLVPTFNQGQLFEIDCKVLTLVGLRPDKMVNLRSSTIIVLCLIFEVFPEFYFIIKHKHDVQAVFMCLHEFVSLLVFVTRTVVIFFNRQNLAVLIADLKVEWCNSFKESNSRWNTTGKKLEEMNYKTTRNLYVAIFFSGFCYFTIPIVFHFMFLNKSENLQWPLPVQVYYGFDFQDHPLIYIFFIVITIPHMLLVTLTFYGVDIFFINILIFCNSFMGFIQCEIERLKWDLENFLVDCNSIKKRISRIARIHNKVIELCTKLENILNLLMLILYTVNTLVLCFLFFEFNILLNDYINLLKVLIFFAVVQTVLILFSYFGTKLREESEAVGDAIYDLPWYTIKDCKIRKHLILTIIRSQKSGKITAGKFFPINLESYFNSLTTAFSYCTVLLKVM